MFVGPVTKGRSGHIWFRALIRASVVLSSALLGIGCTADVAVVATPVSAELFDVEQLERAEEAGAGRVILIPPGGDDRLGILRPSVGARTSLLILPDVSEETVASVGGGRHLFFDVGPHGGGGDETAEFGAVAEEADKDRIVLDRRGGFRRAGELVAAYVENRLESEPTTADTITVRLFLLQGSEERLEEGKAMLEPIRELLPSDRILLEEVNPGFGVQAIEQRIGEARQSDPLLLLLGAPGMEPALRSVGQAGPVVTESLFLPLGGIPAETAEPGTLYLVGVDPTELIIAARQGRDGAIEAAVHGYPEGLEGIVPR